MILVLLGPPGSGKGTQAKELWSKRHLPQLSTGDMLRAAVRAGSKLGLEVKSVMDQGLLVSDSLVIRLIEERVQEKECQNGFVLDGFPRNLDQAKALDQMLARLGKKVDRVLSFEIAEAELIKRLSGRRTCLNCNSMFHIETAKPKQEGICDNCGQKLVQRDDDQPATIQKRQSVYQQHTAPLVEFYEGQKKLYRIKAAETPSRVSEQVAGALK